MPAGTRRRDDFELHRLSNGGRLSDGGRFSDGGLGLHWEKAKPRSCGWLACAVWVLSSLARAGGADDRLFVGGAPYPAGGRVMQVILDDFDGDGFPDAAAASPSEGRLSVLLSDGRGRFLDPVTYSAGISPIALSSGDLDGDDAADIVTASNGSSTLSVFLGRGDGSFDDGVEYTTGGLEPLAIALAEFTGDGRLDAVTTNFRSGSVVVLGGDGRGGFPEELRSVIRVGDNPHHLAIGDFDGDGRADVAVPHSGALSWFIAAGGGRFQRGDLATTPDPRIVAAGPLTDDRRDDIAVILDDLTLGVYESTGDGFELRRIGSVPGDTLSRVGRTLLDLVDFDSDGHVDIVTELAREVEFGIRVHYGGDENFSRRDDVFVDVPASDAAFADLGQDGFLDAVIARLDLAEVSVFSGLAPGRLGTRQSFRIEREPRDIAVARAPGGDTELVVLTERSVSVLHVEPQIDGRVEDLRQYGALSLNEFVVRDLDGDGVDDFVLSDVFGSVIVGLREPDGSVRNLPYPTGDLTTRIAVGDVDGDGAFDVVALDRIAGVRVVSNAIDDARARILALEVPVGTSALAVGAVDQDGFDDIVASTPEALVVVHGDERFTFTRRNSIDAMGRAVDVLVHDLNGDDAAEIIALLPTGELNVVFDPFAVDARVLARSVDASGLAPRIAAQDLDGDGLPDVAVTARSTLTVLRGSANGLEAPVRISVGDTPRGVIFVDVTGDGRLDAVTADSGSEAVSILVGENTTSADRFRRGDVDADLDVGLTDAVVLLGGLFLGRGPVACPDAADADDDGRISVSDAIYLLGYRFRGGPPPPDPGPDHCGLDRTIDELVRCGATCP